MTLLLEDEQENIRGAAYANVATECRQHFGLDTAFVVEKFDRFCIERKFIIQEPESYDPASPEWPRLIKQRQEAKKRINNGAASDLIDLEDQFQLDVVDKGETWILKRLLSYSIREFEKLPENIKKAFNNRKKAIDELLKSKNFDTLSPALQHYAQSLSISLRGTGKRIAFEVKTCNDDFADFRDMADTEIRQKLADGQPINGFMLEFLKALGDE